MQFPTAKSKICRQLEVAIEQQFGAELICTLLKNALQATYDGSLLLGLEELKAGVAELQARFEQQLAELCAGEGDQEVA